jgi:hypothetical protein
MRQSQRGLSIVGLILILFVLVVIGVFSMKLIPSYLEFRAAKRAIDAIAAQNPGSPAEVRKSFERQSEIDDITSVKENDLEITKDGNQVVIGFAYRKEIPMWGDAVGVYINYAARSGGQ